MSLGQLAASTQPRFPFAPLGDALYPPSSVPPGARGVLHPGGGEPRGLGVLGRCLLAVLPGEWSPARGAGEGCPSLGGGKEGCWGCWQAAAATAMALVLPGPRGWRLGQWDGWARLPQ